MGDPMDTGYKRIQYVRYADDFLIGVIGSKEDAEKIKSDIGRFFEETLKLELSVEKTLITNSDDKARFLGYDVTVCNDSALKKAKGKGTVKAYTGKIKLYLPKEKWVGKLLGYGVLKIVSRAGEKKSGSRYSGTTIFFCQCMKWYGSTMRRFGDLQLLPTCE